MKAITKTATQTPAAVTPADPDFNTLRLYLGAEKGSVVQAISYMVLAGIEIERLRKKYDVKRGGDRRANPHGADLLPWSQRLKEQTGLTEDTAARRVLVAKSVKARSKVIQEYSDRLLEMPFTALPQEDQVKIIAATKGACDGETAKSLMQEHSVTRKDKGANLKKDRNKGGNSTAPVSSPQQDAQNALGPFLRTALALRHDFPGKFRRHLFSLPLEREEGRTLKEQISATELLAEMEGWLRETKEAVDAMAKAARASRIKDPAERQAAVTAQLLATLPAEAEQAA